jgi:hypothetical protein
MTKDNQNGDRSDNSQKNSIALAGMEGAHTRFNKSINYIDTDDYGQIRNHDISSLAKCQYGRETNTPRQPMLAGASFRDSDCDHNRCEEIKEVPKLK